MKLGTLELYHRRETKMVEVLEFNDKRIPKGGFGKVVARAHEDDVINFLFDKHNVE